MEEICKVIPNLIYKKELLNIEKSEIPKAPGMKYRHYAPDIPVTLVEGEHIETAKWIKENVNKNDVIICFQEFLSEFKDYQYVYNLGSFKMLNIAAQKIFDLLRECDKLSNVNHIYIQAPNNNGLGISINNRLEKASSGNIIYI